MIEIKDYTPYDGWKRNYSQMGDEKLLDVLSEFEHSEETGYITPAVQRVMAHGGDLNDNYIACHDQAWKRGLVPSRV